MVPEVSVGFPVPSNEIGGIGIVLDKPALPEVGDAFLVARRTDDTESMEVDSAFDGIRGFGGDGGDEDGVAF